MSDNLICGVDEAGRGPLAGPVVAAAVILDPQNPIPNLMDSKKLSESKREKLYSEIITKSLSYAICQASELEIDNLNILQASLLAMARAIENLSITPHLALIDGNQKPKLHTSQIEIQTIIKGDQLEPCISAASILAKVTRDRQCLELDKQYPDYGFAKHKGYPTKAHIAALEQHGPCPAHRMTFGPVNRVRNLDSLSEG